MSTERTPQGTRPHGQEQAQAQATPVVINNPPPGIPAPMMLSLDQFQAFLETCKSSPGPAMALHRDDGGADILNVSYVSVKLPTFWTHDPDLWFLQTESVFNTRTPKSLEMVQNLTTL